MGKALLEHIYGLPDNHVVFELGEECATVHDLKTLRLSFSVQVSGKSVAIAITDPLALALLLVQLSCLCRQIIILPPNLDSKTHIDLLAKANPDIFFTDQNSSLLKPLQDIHCEYISRQDIVTGSQKFWPPEEADCEWVMATSGTTGSPKLVCHQFSSLIRRTKISNSVEGGWRWGMLYEISRFAGLQVYLQAILGGGTLILTNSEVGFSSRFQELLNGKVNCLSATPSLWRKFLMWEKCKKLNLRQITLGGEITDDFLLAQLKRYFPEARITHIYASTEAGSAFAITDERAGFPLELVDGPNSDATIMIKDGRLWIKNDHVSPKYLGSDHSFIDTNGFVDTGDNIRVEKGRCFFDGRDSGVINVGGDKVHPEKVETCLLKHPSVLEARIYSISNPIVGNLVAADLVPHPNSVLSTEEISEHCRKYLARYEVPAIIKFSKNISISSSGKKGRTTK